MTQRESCRDGCEAVKLVTASTPVRPAGGDGAGRPAGETLWRPSFAPLRPAPSLHDRPPAQPRGRGAREARGWTPSRAARPTSPTGRRAAPSRRAAAWPRKGAAERSCPSRLPRGRTIRRLPARGGGRARDLDRLRLSAQDEFLDLAGGGLRQRPEHDRLRHLEARQVLAAEGDELGLGRAGA